MKRTIATIMIAGAIMTSVACGNDDGGQQDSGGPVRVTSYQMPTRTTDGMGVVDQAKLTAFVAAFRTRYPDLSRDRDDESIQEIVLDTCDDISEGASEQQINDEIRDNAEHDGAVPTQAEVEQIRQMVTPACP